MILDLWNRTAVDWTVLADGLLDLAKQHSRVYHDRDDDLIREYLQQAVNIVERRANVNLVQATYEADGAYPQPYPCTWWARWQSWGVLLPFNNVRAIRFLDDSDPPGEITGAWRIAQQEFGSNRDAFLLLPDQTWPGATTVELDVGVDDKDDLAPALRSLVLRIAASLYEYREANLALTEDHFAPELMAAWRPTA